MDKLVEKYFEIGKLAHRYYLDHKSLGKEFDKISESIIEIEKILLNIKKQLKEKTAAVLTAATHLIVILIFALTVV